MTIRLQGKSNETIEESVSSSLIVLDDMQPVGENLWEHDFGTNYWNPVFYCAMDEEHRQGVISENPAAKGEWWSTKGDANETSKLVVYSEDKPVVFAGMAQRPAILIKDCSNIKINLDVVLSGMGVHVKDSEDVEIVINAEYVGRAINIDNSEDVTVSDSRMENIADAGVRFWKNCAGAVISDSRFHRCGRSSSTGSVYGSRVQGPVHVHGNVFSDQSFGRYWVWDGSAVYPDMYSTKWKVHDNTISDCHLALQDNSGSKGHKFNNNLIVDCDYAYDVTDSKKVGEGKAKVKNNVLVNTKDGGPRTKGNGKNILIKTTGG